MKQTSIPTLKQLQFKRFHAVFIIFHRITPGSTHCGYGIAFWSCPDVLSFTRHIGLDELSSHFSVPCTHLLYQYAKIQKNCDIAHIPQIYFNLHYNSVVIILYNLLSSLSDNEMCAIDE